MSDIFLIHQMFVHVNLFDLGADRFLLLFELLDDDWKLALEAWPVQMQSVSLERFFLD